MNILFIPKANNESNSYSQRIPAVLKDRLSSLKESANEKGHNIAVTTHVTEAIRQYVELAEAGLEDLKDLTKSETKEAAGTGSKKKQAK